MTRPRTPRGRRGRTLVEMLAVLAVLGVVASAVVPAPRASREDDVERTAHELATLLRRARATAADRGTAVTLVLDPDARRAWVLAGDDAPPLAGLRVAPDAAVALEGEAPRARWTFTPDGRAFGAPVVVRAGARALQVRVDPWTGEPHVAPR